MICKKCNAPGTLIVKRLYTFCDDCFRANVIHKFRACIGKNAKLSSRDKVLICLSTNTSSLVLLDLIKNSIALDTHKKLRISPIFLHIKGLSTNDSSCISMVNHCKNNGVDLHTVDISDLNSDDQYSSINLYKSCKDLKYKISDTALIDLMSRIKQDIFYKMAKQLGCNLIFTAETNTSLSSKLLSNIVTGRGSQIENDIGFCDDRDTEIKLFRPMREITEEELQYYLKIQQIEPINEPLIAKNSLQSLITDFISDLSENSPATISTICKTADKIGSDDDKKSNRSCKLCQNNLNSKANQLTAIDAITFSKMISSNIINPKLIVNTTEESLSPNHVFPKIDEDLCYSCSKMYSEVKL